MAVVKFNGFRAQSNRRISGGPLLANTPACLELVAIADSHAIKLGQLCRVYARIRPLKDNEAAGDWKVEETVVSQQRNAGTKKFSLDQVFGEQANTYDVYQKTTQPLIPRVLDGFNCTVFAYGQTSSGKTHTMRGNNQELGVIGNAVTDLFAAMPQQTDRQFCVRVSYMEVRPCAQISRRLLAQTA